MTTQELAGLTVNTALNQIEIDSSVIAPGFYDLNVVMEDTGVVFNNKMEF